MSTVMEMGRVSEETKGSLRLGDGGFPVTGPNP